jgi:hypothetical protein
MVRRDGVSVFESDIVIQSAKGIGGRRDRRRLQYRSRLTRLPAVVASGTSTSFPDFTS